MSNLIDRQYVINALELGLENDYVDATELLAYVKQLPSVEPERKKGKWQITSIKSETWGVCSNCNFKQKAGKLNFCPNCGADMRGE